METWLIRKINLIPGLFLNIYFLLQAYSHHYSSTLSNDKCIFFSIYKSNRHVSLPSKSHVGTFKLISYILKYILSLSLSLYLPLSTPPLSSLFFSSASLNRPTPSKPTEPSTTPNPKILLSSQRQNQLPSFVFAILHLYARSSITTPTPLTPSLLFFFFFFFFLEKKKPPPPPKNL